MRCAPIVRPSAPSPVHGSALTSNVKLTGPLTRERQRTRLPRERGAAESAAGSFPTALSARFAAIGVLTGGGRR
jgi:hypothetical protein